MFFLLLILKKYYLNKKRCKTDCKIAFAMNPVQINEVFSIADNGLIMPPKSTWFEPKPKSGCVVRIFN